MLNVIEKSIPVKKIKSKWEIPERCPGCHRKAWWAKDRKKIYCTYADCRFDYEELKSVICPSCKVIHCWGQDFISPTMCDQCGFDLRKEAQDAQ